MLAYIEINEKSITLLDYHFFDPVTWGGSAEFGYLNASVVNEWCKAFLSRATIDISRLNIVVEKEQKMLFSNEETNPTPTTQEDAGLIEFCCHSGHGIYFAKEKAGACCMPMDEVEDEEDDEEDEADELLVEEDEEDDEG